MNRRRLSVAAAFQVGILLSGMLAVTHAGEPDPQVILKQLSESYYDLADAGLARASCYVESREILKQFDKTAKKILGEPDYEAVVVPGRLVNVKARDIPHSFGKDARGGIALYSLAAELVLNAILGVLNEIPELLDPDRVATKYEVTLGGGPGEWKIVLTSRAMVNDKGKRVLLWGRKKDAQEGLRPSERVVITLGRDDRLRSVETTKSTGTERVDISLRAVDGKWAVEALDIGTYDDRGRLVERKLYTIVYVCEKGLYLPSRITGKVVDKDGQLVKRRDEPNPVSIRFSRYRIEVRQ